MQIFCDVYTHEGEVVCVELVATEVENLSGNGGKESVLFLGGIPYQTLSRVYDNKVGFNAGIRFSTTR